MEAAMLNVKFLMFFALEFVVVALVAIVLLAGLYELVHQKVSDLRERALPGRTPATAPVKKD
jgi:hypothetical protein